MEIIIGREPVNSRLLITVNGKSGVIGVNGSVPATVSRNKRDGSGHCRIIVDGSGNMTITNMKPENTTYVDGVQVESKKISNSSKIELGEARYEVSVASIMNVVDVLTGKKSAVSPAPAPTPTPAPAPAPKPEQPTYSLKPLEKIWSKYEKELLDMQIEQGKMASRQRLQGILSMCATMCTFIEALGTIRFIILGLALLCAIYFFWQSSNTSNLFAVKKKKLEDKFEKNYVCPNPDCKCFKGNIKYISLKNQQSCPVCKCKYTC